MSGVPMHKGLKAKGWGFCAVCGAAITDRDEIERVEPRTVYHSRKPEEWAHVQCAWDENHPPPTPGEYEMMLDQMQMGGDLFEPAEPVRELPMFVGSFLAEGIDF